MKTKKDTLLANVPRQVSPAQKPASMANDSFAGMSDAEVKEKSRGPGISCTSPMGLSSVLGEKPIFVIKVTGNDNQALSELKLFPGTLGRCSSLGITFFTECLLKRLSQLGFLKEDVNLEIISSPSLSETSPSTSTKKCFAASEENSSFGG